MAAILHTANVKFASCSFSLEKLSLRQRAHIIQLGGLLVGITRCHIELLFHPITHTGIHISRGGFFRSGRAWRKVRNVGNALQQSRTCLRYMPSLLRNTSQHEACYLLLTGITDSSGFTLVYTSTVPKNEAGILALGMIVSPFLIIPPKTSSYTVRGFCTPNCTSTVSETKTL